MRILISVVFILLYTGLLGQWVSVGPRDVKKLCREKIRVFELEEVNDRAKSLNKTIRDFFTNDWNICEVKFIPHQDNNPEYEEDGFHIVFYFQYNQPKKGLLAGKDEKGDYSFHVNFNSCKPNDQEKEHYKNSLISYDLWRDIPASIEDTARDPRTAVLDYTYEIGLKNKLTLTLHCFQNLLKDIVDKKQTDLKVLASDNIKSTSFPIVVFNKGDLPSSIDEEKEFKKYSERKILVVEPKYFKNSKQGFVQVGVVLIYPYRNPDKTDTISVYEINSGKLIGRFDTVLDKAGTITKKEVIQILDNMEASS